MTFKWFQMALNYLAITCRIVCKPERLCFTERKLRSQMFLEDWNTSVWDWHSLPSYYPRTVTFGNSKCLNNTMWHTNIPCEKIPLTSASLLPSRGSTEPILIIITCKHHPRDRKSLKNKISQGLSADQKANRDDGRYCTYRICIPTENG